MAKTYRIALYPGDGIGPDVVDATRVVLDALERHPFGFHLEYQSFDWGRSRPTTSSRRFAVSTPSFSAPSAGLRACPITSRLLR
jgi:isocitrate/isopropylmalate dehydrogenase